MKTHVIILSQGSQSRLPGLPVAKQLLPLPACSDTPILHRTIRQLWTLLPLLRVSASSQPVSMVTVVGSLAMAEALVYDGAPVGPGLWYCPDVQTLRDPGNSSLKGISRYLELPPTAVTSQHFDRHVVLLGDVVYSWACLREIFDVGPPWCVKFVGTSDLSRSGGELWGLSWTWEADKDMRAALADALAKHPPFNDTYQPGQMRRWLWEIDERFAARPADRPVSAAVFRQGWFCAVDDYTMDVDLPEHIEWLTDRSRSAAGDDRTNGVLW